MSALAALLKLAQRRMDALGLEASRIAERIGGLRAQEATLVEREQKEIALAHADPALAPFMPAYQARMKQATGEARTSIAEAEATLALVREQLAAAYREKSKFEQLIEQERLRRAEARAAVEQKMLDEVAINRAGRE